MSVCVYNDAQESLSSAVEREGQREKKSISLWRQNALTEKDLDRTDPISWNNPKRSSKAVIVKDCPFDSKIRIHEENDDQDDDDDLIQSWEEGWSAGR